MAYNEILFLGMDIPNEAQDLMDQHTSINHMTEDEQRAYLFGVSEALRAVRTVLDVNDEYVVFHLEGHDCMQEFDYDDLVEIIEERGY